MALTDPVPSNDADALIKNMQVTDTFVNADQSTVDTRNASNGLPVIRTIQGINEDAQAAIDNFDANAQPKLPWITGTFATSNVQMYIYESVPYIAPSATVSNPVELTIDPATSAPTEGDWFAYLERSTSQPFNITIDSDGVTTVEIVDSAGDPIDFKTIARVNYKRTTLIPDTDYTVSPSTNSITLLNITLNTGDIIYGSAGADSENGSSAPVWESVSGTMASGNNFLDLGVSALDVKISISGYSVPDSRWTINGVDPSQLDLDFTANENYEFTALVRTL